MISSDLIIKIIGVIILLFIVYKIFKYFEKKEEKEIKFKIVSKKEEKKKRPKYKGYCEYCKIEEYWPNYFFCKYCNKWFCKKHRLPENHECSGKPKAPPGPVIKMHKDGTIEAG